MATTRSNAYRLDELLPAHLQDALSHHHLKARRLVQSQTHGEHGSRRLGVSADFDHHKMYQPGDPLKHIDWKASARHDRYFVKRYIEESSLAVRLVVDHSGSMGYADGGRPIKYLQAARLAAALAYIITSEGDAAALTLAARGGTEWLPAGSSQRHFVHILNNLAASEPSQEDGLAEALRTMVERQERRGVVVLISDLMFDPAPVMRQLQRLHAHGHEVLLFQVREPTEQRFPFNRWVQFGDLEDPQVHHRLDAVMLKRLYREEYDRLCQEWRDWAKKFSAHLVGFGTDEHVETVVSEYMAFRNGMLGS